MLESSSSYGLGTLGPEVFRFFSGFSILSSGSSSFSSTFSSGKLRGDSLGISKNETNLLKLTIN